MRGHELQGGRTGKGEKFFFSAEEDNRTLLQKGILRYGCIDIWFDLDSYYSYPFSIDIGVSVGLLEVDNEGHLFLVEI